MSKSKRINTNRLIAFLVNIFLLSGALYLLIAADGPMQPTPSMQSNNAEKNGLENSGALVSGLDTIDSRSIQSVVNEWSSSTDGTHSISVVPGDMTIAGAELNSSKQMISASTYKLFLAYTVLYQQQIGEVSLQQTVASDITISDCLEQLIAVSSDECAYDLGSLIGWQNIDVFLLNQGYLDTKINNYSSDGEFNGNKLTTAADLARLLTRLEAGLLLNTQNTDYLLSLMKQQVHGERIKAGLPTAVEVANKPGWIDIQLIQNDAAIVYASSKPYILVVLTEGAQAADLARLSRQVYGFMTSVQ